MSFIFSGWYISGADQLAAYSPIQHLLFVPGQSSGVMVLYPLIPWLGLTIFGMFWAKLMREQPKKIYSDALITGIAFLTIFALIRF